MKMLINKLKQKNGESLTETLVALLIAVLALTLLAGMIVSGNRITAKSAEKMTEYYTESNGLSALDDTDMSTESVSGKVSLSKNGNSFSLVPGKASYNLEFFINETFEDNPVISYKVK